MFSECKIFSVVCLCFGKFAGKVFSVFGNACINLFSENSTTTVTSINPTTTGHYKPSYQQPPHNQFTWKSHNQNQNPLISKSKPINIKINIKTHQPKPTTHHHWNPQTTLATNPPPPIGHHQNPQTHESTHHWCSKTQEQMLFYNKWKKPKRAVTAWVVW